MKNSQNSFGLNYTFFQKNRSKSNLLFFNQSIQTLICSYIALISSGLVLARCLSKARLQSAKVPSRFLTSLISSSQLLSKRNIDKFEVRNQVNYLTIDYSKKKLYRFSSCIKRVLSLLISSILRLNLLISLYISVLFFFIKL